MDMAQKRLEGRITRHRRIRKKVNGTTARPRLCVRRTLVHMDAQIVGQSVNPGRKRRRVVTLRIQSVNLYLVHKLVYFDPVFAVSLDASGQLFFD